MNRPDRNHPQAQARVAAHPGTFAPSIEINKCLKNTYILLGMSMLFSGLVAYFTKDMGFGRVNIFVYLGAFMGLTWFIQHFRNSALGLVGVFALTGFLGFAISPVIAAYTASPYGTKLVMAAMGTTGTIFLVLSGYVLVTKKNFRFIGGMMFCGILAVFLLGLANYFFLQMPGLQLALSCLWVLLMSGMILYETSEIVNGGQTNYILATTNIFVALYNMFMSLLAIFGIMGGDD